ncbi:hypothetical protein DQ04_04331040 [Trypanosoma grayi]|uniref:hypothetical protein n=1 Tax=Trypanosoma grayi TaxID=71804 RepID=UPI0004F4640C|nr:hypothetical protein DQ04_04331040 [Trypanosoma grayi]KEG09990.1 hypothetical protein DQ04_04331040 [Trypanosoma grayi]
MAPPLLAVRQFVYTHEVPLDDDGNNTNNDAGDNYKDKKGDATFSSNNNKDCGAHGATRAVTVARITAQVVSFDHRCFWVHLSESRESGDAPPPPLGPCAVAFGGLAVDVTSTTLIDDAQLPQQQEQQQGGGGVSAPNPQAVFAQSLAQRIARRLQQECGAAVAVYVACGISGEKAELIGTPAGSSLDVTMRFGAVVFRNVMELIREELLPPLPA